MLTPIIIENKNEGDTDDLTISRDCSLESTDSIHVLYILASRA